MKSERWWSVIFTLGLFMALSPLSAQAWPNRPSAAQPHCRAFTPPQPRSHVNNWSRQPHQWQQHRGPAYGWNGQNRQWHQPVGHANAWNRQPHPRQQHPGQAYGWNGQNRQWQQPRGPAYGWNGHQRQGDQYRNVYGRNDYQHQWDRGHNVYGRNDQQHQWQPRPDGGQSHPAGPAFNRAGYPAQPQAPHNAPNTPGSGYSHNSPSPTGQTGTRPSYHQPDAAGNAPLPQNQSRSGVI